MTYCTTEFAVDKKCCVYDPMKALAEALNDVKSDMRDAVPVPVVSNVTGEIVNDAGTIRRLLVEQLTQTVHWQKSMEACLFFNDTRREVILIIIIEVLGLFFI